MKLHLDTMLSPLLLGLISILSPNFGISVLAILGSLTFILLNISKLKFEIIDKECGGSWLIYFKKLFNFLKK